MTRYRKLSAKVHPDKLRDEPNARECFVQVREGFWAIDYVSSWMEDGYLGSKIGVEE